MRAFAVVFFIHFRIVLPLTLLIAAVLRYSAVSFIHLTCLLIILLIPSPYKHLATDAALIFMRCLLVISIVPVLGHVVFTVFSLLVIGNSWEHKDIFQNCSNVEKTLRQIGYQRLYDVGIWNILRLVAPDIAAFVVAVATMILYTRLRHQQPHTTVVLSDYPLIEEDICKNDRNFTRSFMGYFQNVALLTAGTILPSLLGGLYFFMFLICLTLWGCYKPIGSRSNTLRRFLLFFTGSHILLLHLYQFQFFQEAFPPSNLAPRLLGLTGIILTDCNDVSQLIFHQDLEWSVFVNPFLLLSLYWILSINNNMWMNWRYRKVSSLSERSLHELVRKQLNKLNTEIDNRILNAAKRESLLEYCESSTDCPDDVVVVSGHRQESPRQHQVASAAMRKRKPWMSLMILVMKQSYILSFIAMITWSITYHSWLTFVFLLTSCFLWILPNSHDCCLRTSPLFVAYAEILLMCQYVICMNFDLEILMGSNKHTLKEVGFEKFPNPFPHLLLQTGYNCLIVLTLRQYWYENKQKIHKGAVQDYKSSILNIIIPWNIEQRTFDGSTVTCIGNCIWLMMCKYWIFVCAILMVAISVQEIVIYRIIYMFLFLIFVIIFNLNFKLWRAISYCFWWIVVVYSMLVLTLIYTFQFENIQRHWVNVTGFSEDLLQDIGLEKYDTPGLFVKLLTPTCFLVVVIIQLRYFHVKFLYLSCEDRYCNISRRSTKSEMNRDSFRQKNTSINNNTERRKHGDASMKQWLIKNSSTVNGMWDDLTSFLWRLCQIHILKVVTFTTFVVSAAEVSALTAVYVLLIAVLFPLNKAGHILSNLLLIWTAFIIMIKMLFQLRVVNVDIWSSSCNNINHTAVEDEFENTAWFGLKNIEEENISIAYYLRLYILILAVIVSHGIIRYHQKQYYKRPGNPKPPRGILFSDIKRDDADAGIVPCIKFLANYAFYKFGLEFCYIMTAVVASIRVDAISVLYIMMSSVLIMASRHTVAQLWHFYKLILSVLLACQFYLVLGFPFGACIVYPWTEALSNTPNLRQWLFLPAYLEPPKAYKLIMDFLQLLFVSMQAFVFKVEASVDKMDHYGGGDNADILADVENNLPIPCSDFTLEQKSGIETVKFLVFENMYWLTMAVIFITGATRINIFSFFYLVAVFIFMWYGKEFYIKPLRSLLRIWNYLISYCLLVLLLKTALQLVGCVYFDYLVTDDMCWMVQLFGVNCFLTGAVINTERSSKCVVEEDNAGLAWDVICLSFLLLQRRVYSSHYFRHIADTIQAQNNLVAKGAEIINRILIRNVQKQNMKEFEILMNIKKQMRELKARQALLKKDYKEPEEHFQAIRSGDYFLLDYEENDFNKKQVPDPQNQVPHENASTANTAKDVSTSVDLDAEDATKQSKSKHLGEKNLEPSTVNKIRMLLNMLCILWFRFIDELIHLCNNLSHNYRLVAKKLAKELIIEKEIILAGKNARMNRGVVILDELEIQDEDEMRLHFQEGSQRFNRLIVSGGLVLASHSELLCYFLMILNQMAYASLLSLPLPLMVFLWGMLSVPRPSKTFWVTVITYTESVVVCKYLFQFGFFPWNEDVYRDSPFFPPRIIGIEKVENYSYVDIALLLALFLHRSILRKYGLWRDASDIGSDIENEEFDENMYQGYSHLMSDDDESSRRVSSDISSTSQTSKRESKLRQGVSYIISPFAAFFMQVTHSTYNASTDMYAPMFFCDFILFLIVVFGFSSFGSADTTGDEDLTNYIRDSKIPIPFLVMLVTQFIIILIDRAIYLKKFVLGKFIFQLLLVILLHIWMFLILPAVTKRSFFNNIAAQLWYLVKCIYFALSANQIRCGYPNRILGNFLTKNYGITNLILFKGFLSIPFLLELRAVMDWIWTDSSLAIGNWLQMEDIYANIFVAKCWREIEKIYPQERGTKKPLIIKYLAGGALLILIIFIIWFPLVFFSLFSTVFISSPPHEASITVSVGGYQPLFTATALGDSIRTLTQSEYEKLKSRYLKDRYAYSFFGGYGASDVTLTEFDGKSMAIWGISPIGQSSLSEILGQNKSRKLVFSVKLKFVRVSDKSQAADVKYNFEINLRQPSKENSLVSATLASIINSTSNDSVNIYGVFPRFLRLSSQSEMIVLDNLVKGKYGIGYSNISLSLQLRTTHQTAESWSLSEILHGSSAVEYDPNSVQLLKDKAWVITFNDRKTPDSLSYIAGFSIFKGGVVVMYVSFVLVVFKFVRVSFVSGRMLYIYIEEAPDVDYLLQTIDDMYLAREMKDYWLEEEIFAKLLFILRCPDVMFYVTRIRSIVPVNQSFFSKFQPGGKTSKQRRINLSLPGPNDKYVTAMLGKRYPPSMASSHALQQPNGENI